MFSIQTLASYFMLIAYAMISLIPGAGIIAIGGTGIPNIIAGLVFFTVIFIGLYFVWDYHNMLLSELKESKSQAPATKQASTSWYQYLFGWITMKYIGYFCLSTIIIGYLIGAYYLYNSMGLFNLNAGLSHSGLITLCSIALYYSYDYFFPTNFWQRLTLHKHKYDTLIDCRTAGEYESSHHKKSQHWPLKTLTVQNINDRLPDLGKKILVHSNNGKRAKIWKDRMIMLLTDLKLKGYSVYWTDAHWTQIN